MRITNTEFFEVARSVLASGRAVSFNVKGNSMFPYLKDGDRVLIKSKSSYAKGDIVLARVFSSDQVVLHYITDVSGDFFKLMGAANLYQKELCLKKDVAGCVVGPGINRWRVIVWDWLLPIRRIMLLLYRRIL